ncbi:MAG: translation initiation factor IF-2 [Acidaminococcaceae bacterium]
MGKYRVFEIAKEYETTSKVILDILERNSVPVKNHMSSVDDEVKAIISRTFARKSDNPTAKPAQKQATVTPHVEKTAVATSGAPTVHNEPVAKIPVVNTSAAATKPVAHTTPSNNVQQKPQAPAVQPHSVPVSRPVVQHHNGTQQFVVGGSNNSRPGQHTPGQVHQSQGTRPQGQNAPRPQGQGTMNARPGQNAPRPQGQGTMNSRSGQSAPRPQGQGTMNARPGQGAPRPQGQRPQGSYAASGNRPQTQGQRPLGSASTVNNTRPQVAGATKPNFTKPDAKKGQTKRFDNKPQPQGSYATKGSRPNRSNTRMGRNNKRQGGNSTFVPQTVVEVPKPTNVAIAPFINVKAFADLIKREVSDVIKHLFLLGVMVTINQDIDFDTAVLIGSEFDVEVEELPPEDDPTEVPEVEDDPAKRLPRPPVITVMGHVDHGKTSLLDAIRKANVTSREAGGITQHIGAYQVNYQGKKIVFLDTPGHEAFTAMRARGAQVTDVAILVVAADDGVMPQTIEAINHAKAAKVPIIVAINKMDREGANADHVKQQLAEHELIPEDWGGETIMVPVSAHQKTGIPELLEMILLVAEVQDLKANPELPAHGTIIEAQLDKGRGPVATVLVEKGTLHIGDTILAGTAYGKVRAMINDRGEQVKKAGPSTPVEVLGLSDVPMAGDILDATEERIARAVAEKRIAKKKTEEIQQNTKVSLDDLFQRIQEGELKELNIVVKADVQGTIEALKQSLVSIKNEEVKVVIVHAGVGTINESDVMLASAANALVIGFNVRPAANARKLAEAEKVDVRTYRVIYDAINDVEAAIKGMLAPKFKEVIQGRVEVRQLITISKMLIAGCYVLDGKITNASQIRVLRDDVVVHEGELESLRRFKDDVKEVAAGFECGVTLDKYRDLKEGDVLEAFIMEEIKV